MGYKPRNAVIFTEPVEHRFEPVKGKKIKKNP